MYLGNAVLPQPSYATSLIQQQFGNLRVKHLIEANIILNDTLRLGPSITFLAPYNTVSAPLLTMSDSSHVVNGS